MSPDVASAYTADEFAQLRDWKDWELVDGHLAPFHCGALASHICGRVIVALVSWSRPSSRGWVFGSAASYNCFPNSPHTVRRPWFSFVPSERMRREGIPRVGHLTLAPDVAGIVLTPLHTGQELARWVADFKSAGVRLIWVVSPETRSVLVRRADGTLSEVGEAGALSGEDVLPGFTCAVADLFV